MRVVRTTGLPGHLQRLMRQKVRLQVGGTTRSKKRRDEDCLMSSPDVSSAGGLKTAVSPAVDEALVTPLAWLVCNAERRVLKRANDVQ